MLNNCSNDFESPEDSPEHSLLRNTAWMGGELVEGRYLLGMLLGTNLFRVDNDSYYRELSDFITNNISKKAATVFCNPINAKALIPYLRMMYDETDLPPFCPASEYGPPRNERVETATVYLLHNLDASLEEIAKHLSTTVKQVLRLSKITWAKRLIDSHFDTDS